MSGYLHRANISCANLKTMRLSVSQGGTSLECSVLRGQNSWLVSTVSDLTKVDAIKYLH